MSESRECIGCGYCCKERICRIGAMIYGHYTNPCPALTWAENRYLCSLYLEDPHRYELVIDIGGGCCFPLNPQREQMKKSS